MVDTIQGACAIPLIFLHIELNFNSIKKMRNDVGWDSTGLNGLKICKKESIIMIFLTIVQLIYRHKNQLYL